MRKPVGRPTICAGGYHCAAGVVWWPPLRVVSGWCVGAGGGVWIKITPDPLCWGTKGCWVVIYNRLPLNGAPDSALQSSV